MEHDAFDLYALDRFADDGNPHAMDTAALPTVRPHPPGTKNGESGRKQDRRKRAARRSRTYDPRILDHLVDRRQRANGFGRDDETEQERARQELATFRRGWAWVFGGSAPEADLQIDLVNGRISLRSLVGPDGGVIVDVATLSRARSKQWSDILVRVLAQGIYELCRAEGWLP